MKIGYRELLLNRTGLRIGGPAFCWIEPGDVEEILEAISIAEANRKTLIVVGKASNILFKDQGFDGVIINLGDGFDFIEKEGTEVLRVGAAVSLACLIEWCADSGLSGCEFLSGIPASFGGAIFMNAGVRQVKGLGEYNEMKDIIVDVDVLDFGDRKTKRLKLDEIGFSYRFSGLGRKCILSARIKLENDKKSAIINRMDSFMKGRRWIQGLGFPSAGSIFKNPEGKDPAGRLIEACGLKGKRIGGAEISTVHGNVIVNTGNATSRDVLGLIELVRSRVKNRFGIELELELEIM